jgi:hypothetical protein
MRHAYEKCMVRLNCSSVEVSPTGSPYTTCKLEGRRAAIQKRWLHTFSLFLCISCCLATDNPCVLYSTEAIALATTLPHHRRPELRSSGLLRDESPASRTRIVKRQPDMASSSRPGADNDQDESPATRRLRRLCLHLLHLPTASN